MDKDEALAILNRQLAEYANRPYSEVAELVGTSECREIIGGSGATYQIEIDVKWDDKPRGDVRIIGSIDDGGLRAFFPLTQDMLLVRYAT